MSDIATELAKLHILKGAEFIIQLKAIAALGEFHPLKDNPASIPWVENATLTMKAF